MIIRQDGDYWIVQDQRYILMHRVLRPEIQSHAEVVVGEAFINSDGVWEVRVAERKGQRMVRITDSPTIALEVLWEQRILMHWGYYQ